ncbi:MAG: IS91 family transposase [Acidobacteriales bacterium]|nr:IS91 family transposase [Terriglobales bacterium]
MSRPTLELADIFRQHGPAYRARQRLPVGHLRVMRAIETCRTAALGGHVESCGHCAYQRIAYNSCRNRHCPKCQSLAKEQWLQQRKQELLPIPYFHVVFTVPPVIAALALRNKKAVFQILFRTSAQTLLTIAADPQHLGAHIGFFSILHTWGQKLLFHPHLHCVVTGGGLSPDKTGWIASRPRFFLSVRVLSRLFRRLFLEGLEQAYADGQLHLPGAPEQACDADSFQRFLKPARTAEWVVYAKPPFGSPAQVIEYLGRYTHRVAISNQRLLSVNHEQVTFQYKDYGSGDPQRSRQMSLPVEEFLRRFLLHVLPDGFQRIRHYGLYNNRYRAQNLERCRALLAGVRSELLPSHAQLEELRSAIIENAARCPQCKVGRMRRVLTLAALRWSPLLPMAPDTS